MSGTGKEQGLPIHNKLASASRVVKTQLLLDGWLQQYNWGEHKVLLDTWLQSERLWEAIWKRKLGQGVIRHKHSK